jgi:predicted RNA polymerase sigma factor
MAKEIFMQYAIIVYETAQDFEDRTNPDKAIDQFQLEAAIQSAHVFQKLNSQDTSLAIRQLYKSLIEITPSVGVNVSFAAFLLSCKELNEAKEVLSKIDADMVVDYQSYWAVLAEAYSLENKNQAAIQAYNRAIALTEDVAIKSFLQDRVRLLA